MTVWVQYAGDPLTGDGTDTITSTGFSGAAETDTSKLGVPWQFEIHITTIGSSWRLGTRDSVAALSYYRDPGELIDGNGSTVTTGPALTNGDILTVSYDGNGSDNVEYRINGTLIGTATNGGFGDPVRGYAVLSVSGQTVQGVWSGLTHPVAGVAEWDGAGPAAILLGERTLPLNMAIVGERTLDLRMAVTGVRTLPLVGGQEGERTIIWFNAATGERLLPVPMSQDGLRTIDLRTPVAAPIGERTLDLAMVGYSTLFGARTLPLSMASVGDRVVDLRTTIPTMGERTLPLAASSALFGERTIDLAAVGYSTLFGERRLPLVMQSTERRSTTGALRLWVRGRPIPILDGEIWADEGSPYWQSIINLARPEDYALLPSGAAYDLELYGTRYAQIVDTRSLSRGFSGEQPGDSATIGGLSPVALQAGQWADGITRTWDTAIRASAVAAEMLGSVDWDAVDWVIPAYRLAAQGQTPVEVVSTLATAVGAALASAPDGALSVRPIYPVRAPSLPGATPGTVLGDDDIYAVSESPESVTVVNQIRITDGTAEADGYQDRLEFEADEDNPLAGTVRAYPLPWRDGISVRSTRSTVRLYRIGEAAREVEEIVTVQDGVAGLRYPPLTLVGAEYLDTDLGGIVVAGSELRTSVQGWGLVRVVYTVRAIEYRAASLEPGISALVLMEGNG